MISINPTQPLKTQVYSQFGVDALMLYAACVSSSLNTNSFDASAKRELRDVENPSVKTGVRIPPEVCFALKHICNIAFGNAESIDNVVKICQLESELKPLLSFVLENHFGKTTSVRAANKSARDSKAQHERGNVIDVVMRMLDVAFDPRDDPYAT